MHPPPRTNLLGTAAVFSAAVLALTLAACRPSTIDREAAAPSPCDRIVTMAPNLTEIAFAVGLGEHVVAVDDYSLFPPAVASLPRVGNLFAPRLEELLTLSPDLALLLPSHGDLASRLGSLGIETLELPHETISDVVSSLRRVGERCAVAVAAEAQAAALEASLAPRDVLNGRTAVLVAGRPPGAVRDLVVAGPGTFLDELLQRLGGRNVFADAPTRWPRASLEELVARGPDLVFELRPEALDAAGRAAVRLDWRALAAIPAVSRGHIAILSGDHTVTPGPRLGLLYQEMAVAAGALFDPTDADSNRTPDRP